ALDVLCEPWPGDDRFLPRPERGFLGALLSSSAARAPRVSPLKIGVLRDPIIGRDTEVHEAALAGVDRAIASLEGLGHSTQAVPVPFAQKDWDPFLDVWSVMAAQAPIPQERE